MTLTIIILNYNTAQLTVRAVRSVLDQPYKDCQVVVVDNASTDDSVEQIRSLCARHRRVSLIARTTNDGFACGNNVALAQAETPYVMLLNSDAYIPKHTQLGTMIEYLREHPRVGVLTPFVQLGSGTIDPACHRGFPTPWNALTYFSGLEQLVSARFYAAMPGVGQRGTPVLLQKLLGGYHQTWKDLDVAHQIDACTAAAMIVSRQAIEEVGLFDERFFMYGEDLDWCYRFIEAGWSIVFFPDQTVVHEKHASGLKKERRTPNKRTRTAFFDAMKLFYEKHYKYRYPAIVYKLILLGIDIKRLWGR